MKRAALSSPLKLSPCFWAKQPPWSHVRRRAFLSKAGIPGAIAESHCLLFPMCIQRLMSFYWTKWCNYANSWCVIPGSPASARLSDFAWSTLSTAAISDRLLPPSPPQPASLRKWKFSWWKPPYPEITGLQAQLCLDPPSHPSHLLQWRKKKKILTCLMFILHWSSGIHFFFLLENLVLLIMSSCTCIFLPSLMPGPILPVQTCWNPSLLWRKRPSFCASLQLLLSFLLFTARLLKLSSAPAALCSPSVSWLQTSGLAPGNGSLSCSLLLILAIIPLPSSLTSLQQTATEHLWLLWATSSSHPPFPFFLPLLCFSSCSSPFCPLEGWCSSVFSPHG